MEKPNSFVIVIFSILCLFWFKILAVSSEARMGRHLRARSSLYSSFWVAFILLWSVLLGWSGWRIVVMSCWDSKKIFSYKSQDSYFQLQTHNKWELGVQSLIWKPH